MADTIQGHAGYTPASIAGGCEDAHVPSRYADNLRVVVASLDFARVWAGHGNREMVAQELDAAAAHAEAFARHARSDAASFR